ncbi:MAG: ECF transporter S component [Firmicutes bacterium]|nr:ECF transporter S component [Bacillota bacterium]
MKEKQKAGSKSRFSVSQLAQMGMLAAVAVVLIIFVQIPLIAAAPYLVYDVADVPILLGAYLIGPIAGLLILTVVSAIQAFMLGGNGIIGFIMHMAASGALVVIAALLYRSWGKTNRSLIISLIAGGVAMTALMIPLNLIFTPLLFGMPIKAVTALILPVLLPFNLIKAGLTSVLFFLIFKSLRIALKGRVQ